MDHENQVEALAKALFGVLGGVWDEMPHDADRMPYRVAARVALACLKAEDEERRYLMRRAVQAPSEE